jgi:hypothetical protein
MESIGFVEDAQSGIYRYQFKSAKAGSHWADVVVVCKYSKSKYEKKGVRYFCYAIYGLGAVSVKSIFKKYRRRYSIESGGASDALSSCKDLYEECGSEITCGLP